MQNKTICIIILATIALSSCINGTTHLITPSDAVLVPDAEGEWSATFPNQIDHGTVSMTLRRSGDKINTYDLKVRSMAGEMSGLLVFTKINNRMYADCLWSKISEQTARQLEGVHSYFFVEKIEDSTLCISTMKNYFEFPQSPDSEILQLKFSDNHMIITCDSIDLRDYISKHGRDAFGDTISFKKK